ncbi:protein kinase domain-containing protein [Nocardiopsis tropica]|uniref:non-specific serine/threonine protein kinase n=1 Tax=Nocardiopsis tropica TaxID=109330 RepID=A0ABV2A2D1_9ACTN
MPEPPHWLPDSVGKYYLRELLGTGGFGAVYLGETSTGERAAVKLLHREHVGDTESRRRFKGEVERLQHVGGPSVACVLDSDTEAPIPWIATEYIEGPTLQTAVEREGARRGAELYRLAIRTAEALAAIHVQGVVHRDLKPDNILLSPEGPRVIDFGISRVLESTSTLPTSKVGSPGYTAPEQLRDDPITTAVDVFTWGCVLLFAATGHRAFPGRDQAAWMGRILFGEPETGDLREPLLTIVLSCLARDPRERPSAMDLIQCLLRSHSSGAWSDDKARRGSVGPSVDQLGAPRVPATLALTKVQEDRLIHAGSPTDVDESDLWGSWQTPPPPSAPKEHALAEILVSTVTDLVRAGLPSVPTNLLAQAHKARLRGVRLPEGTSFIEEMNWACRPAPAGAGLLVSLLGNRWRPSDRVLEEADGPVPRDLWFVAAANAPSEVGPADIATNALHMDEYEIALSILAQASEQEDLPSKGLLGLLSMQARDYDRAEPLLREVVETTGLSVYKFHLGELLHMTDRTDEAERWYLEAAHTGSAEAMAHLGVMYSGQAEQERSQGWLRQSAEAGEPLGMVLWSFDLSLRGQPRGAREWYDRALGKAGSRGLLEAGELFHSLGRPEAEDFFEAAARHGDEVGRMRLEELRREAEKGPTEPDWYVRQVPLGEVDQVFTDLFGADGPWTEPGWKER